MKFNFNIRLCITIIAAIIASLATFPYGYKFITLFNLSNQTVSVIIGCLLGGSAAIANAILGIYSLSNIKFKKSTNIYKIGTLCILGAIPTGFFSYFGYSQILPASINITASIIVVIVNTGINFTAIINLLKKIKQFFKNEHTINKKLNVIRTTLCSLGGVIGLIISLTAYLATTNGIAQIVNNFASSEMIAVYIGSIIAILTWLPLAALYLNSTEVVSEKIYDFLSSLKINSKNITFYDMLLIIFVLLSGTAFSRMVYDFYNPHNMIPEFFKLSFIQSIAYYLLVPLALVSSAAVNYFAFINMLQAENK